MTLAQVAYQISRDTDFATQMRMDPESALAERGFSLSKEERAFLSSGLRRETDNSVNISAIAERMARSWL